MITNHLESAYVECFIHCLILIIINVLLCMCVCVCVCDVLMLNTHINQVLASQNICIGYYHSSRVTTAC